MVVTKGDLQYLAPASRLLLARALEKKKQAVDQKRKAVLEEKVALEKKQEQLQEEEKEFEKEEEELQQQADSELERAVEEISLEENWLENKSSFIPVTLESQSVQSLYAQPVSSLQQLSQQSLYSHLKGLESQVEQSGYLSSDQQDFFMSLQSHVSSLHEAYQNENIHKLDSLQQNYLSRTENIISRIDSRLHNVDYRGIDHDVQ